MECPSLSSQYAFLVLPAQFLGGLAALGLLLFFAARRALAAKRGGRPPPLCGEGGSGTAVAEFLLWVWAALQTLSALFSQTVADGSVPPRFVPVFAAFSALQFQGVTLAPACNPDGDPFSALWVTVAAAYGAVGVGGASVALLYFFRAGKAERGNGAPLWREHAARAALQLVVTFFSVGFGAFVGTAVGTLACSAPARMSVADYAATRGDGAALRAAFGAFLSSGVPLPNMTVLRLAASDPDFADRAGLTELLASTVSAPLLGADANIVCGEGSHALARAAALGLLALLAGCLPLLALAAQCSAGKLKGVRRCFSCGGRGSSGALAVIAAAPPSAPRLLTAALWNRDLLPRAQWVTAQDWLLTALCTGLTAYAGIAASLQEYLRYQLTMAAALLGSAVLLWRVRPAVDGARWKTRVQIAVFIVACAAACANVALRYVLPAGGTGALAVCSFLLLLSAGALALLLTLWWRALAKGGSGEARVRATPHGALVVRAPAAWTRNPLTESGGALPGGGARGEARVLGRGGRRGDIKAAVGNLTRLLASPP
jgi:hypothetical protein